MKKSKNNRRAIILNKCSDGIFAQPLMDSLLFEIEKKYIEYVSPQNENEIDNLIDVSIPNDIFVIGGKKIMITASRLGLHFREKNIDARCVFIPACPYNSIPFNDFSYGFGSALNWCTDLGNDMLSIRKNSRNNCRVVIIEIDGDDNGWLTAGAASLISEKEKIIFLTCETIFDEENFCIAVARKIKKYNTAVIFTSQEIRNAGLKRINTTNQSISAALSKIITKKLNLNSFALIINPGEMIDSAHLSKQDVKNGTLVGKAAVRLALRTAKQGTNILIANRFSNDGKNKLSFEIVPLFEAINTPRKLPKNYKTLIDTKFRNKKLNHN
jgi:6-phosphofructokinase